MARYALRKRVLSTDSTDFSKPEPWSAVPRHRFNTKAPTSGALQRSRDRFLNLSNQWMTSGSQPAPDRVDHDDDGGDHDDRGEAGVDEALERGLRFLRQRPKNIRY